MRPSAMLVLRTAVLCVTLVWIGISVLAVTDNDAVAKLFAGASAAFSYVTPDVIEARLSH